MVTPRRRKRQPYCCRPEGPSPEPVCRRRETPVRDRTGHCCHSPVDNDDHSQWRRPGSRKDASHVEREWIAISLNRCEPLLVADRNLHIGRRRQRSHRANQCQASDERRGAYIAEASPVPNRRSFRARPSPRLAGQSAKVRTVTSVRSRKMNVRCDLAGWFGLINEWPSRRSAALAPTTSRIVGSMSTVSTIRSTTAPCCCPGNLKKSGT